MITARKSSRQTSSLLVILVQQPRKWRYGYDLSKETGLKSGTLYPILMRLCDRGLLASKWEDSPQPGRPPRHMYRLTTPGIAFAKQQVADHAGRGELDDLLGNHA
jgi:DNA-binding PadR family transcriptional regulator